MMEASRELDALIAEKVMTHPHSHWRDPVPHYSTNISDAWQVAEKMRLAVVPVKDGWFAGDIDYVDGGLGDGMYADTAPLAICLAALAAVSQA